MSAILRYFILKNFRDHFTSKIAFAGEAMATFLSLTIYWYTARAFGGAMSHELQPFQENYFSYILIGDVSLFLPFALINGMNNATRQLVSEGTVESLFVLPIRRQLPFLMTGVALIPRELLRMVLTFFIALLIFGFRIDPLRLASALVFQMMAIPAFLGFGLLSCSIFLLSGRGSSAISHALGAAAILAGAYFPVSVLPAHVQALSQDLSPLTVLLEGTRHLLRSGADATVLHFYLSMMIWGVILFTMGYLCLGWSAEHLRRKGSLPLQTI